MQTSKRSIVVFPFRSAAGGQQPRLPACRAWRVVARRAADFAADAPAVAGGVVPAAPAGCKDGAYPLWVTLTDTENGQRAPAPMLVDGDGWNLAPTGHEWTLDYCGGAGEAADRLAYVVEVTGDVSECGQVNVGRDPIIAREWRARAPGDLTTPWEQRWNTPAWARRAHLSYWVDDSVGDYRLALYSDWLDGAGPVHNASNIAMLLQAYDVAGAIYNADGGITNTPTSGGGSFVFARQYPPPPVIVTRVTGPAAGGALRLRMTWSA